MPFVSSFLGVLARSAVVRTKWASVGLLVIATLLPAATACADEFRLMPSASLKEEYNDNIYLDVRNQTRDFITTVSPGVEIYDRTERFEGSLLTKLNSLYYADSTGLDHVDQYYSGNGSYQFTPSLLAKGAAGYIVDSRPDRLLLTTGLVLKATVRHQETGTGSAEYSLGEKSALALSYSFEEDRWNSKTVPNFTGNFAQASFTYDISSLLKNTKARATVGYNNYSFAYSSKSIPIESYSGTIGATTALNEKLTVSVDAGATRTTSDVTRVQLVPVGPFVLGFLETGTETDWAPTGVATLAYRGEKTTADLTAGYQVLPAMGSAGTTNRTYATFSASHRLTYELSGTLSCQYFYNKSTQTGIGISQIDSGVFSFSPGLRYEFTRDFFLEGTYTYTRIDNNVNNTSASRNQFMLRLTLQHRLLE